MAKFAGIARGKMICQFLANVAFCTSFPTKIRMIKACLPRQYVVAPSSITAFCGGGDVILWLAYRVNIIVARFARYGTDKCMIDATGGSKSRCLNKLPFRRMAVITARNRNDMIIRFADGEVIIMARVTICL